MSVMVTFAASTAGPPSTMDALAFILNIGAAMLLGMVIGLEREFRGHPAGLRTNALVCLGAAMFVALPQLLGGDSSPTRVAGQVVSGIGFLGGGVILREGLTVRGMNTAATLWCSAAIGVLAGSGLPLEAALGTAAILLVNVCLRPVVRRLQARAKTAVEVETVYRMRAVCQTQEAGLVRNVFMRHINSHPSMNVQGLAMQDTEQAGVCAVVAEIFSHERNDKYLNEMVQRLGIEPCVTAVSWERVR
ncbi:MAG TPA: MgtC/SapB family protein [Gemmataceae bacterium]|nr:MgtC/SapB family protein [Gemmataceae bacterium]